MTSRTRVEIIDTVNKTKCAVERNKRLPEAKNSSTLLPWIIPCNRAEKNGRFYLTLFLRVQNGELYCSRSYLRYISTKSHNLGTYITCTPTYAIPTRNASHNFSKDTRDTRSKCSCSCIRVMIKTLRERAFLEFIHNEFINGKWHMIE